MLNEICEFTYFLFFTVIYNVKDIDGNERIVWGLTGGIVRHVMSQLAEAEDVYR